MHIYRKIYEFAASAGAFEGYVYHKLKDQMDLSALTNWANNLISTYENLPPDVLKELQAACDQTVGRAVRSVASILGEDHTIVAKLKSMVTGVLPASADDFQKRKWFEG